jgi:hypothetical protein
MSDDTPAANDDDAAADAVPPREPRWRKFVKPFLITLAFTIVVDLGSRFLASRAGQAKAAAMAVKSFGQGVEYGLESVNLWETLRRAGRRLTNERYHTAVANLKTPFNLSEACRNGEARRGVYGIEVSKLCYLPPPPPLHRNPLESVIVPVLPPPPGGPVDATKYPRSDLREIPLGLPDAARHTLRCAWDGRDHCDPARALQPRGNWFGKLLLVAAALFSLAVAFSSGKTRQDEPPRAFSFVVIFVISLLYAGMACAALLLAVKVLAFLGLWLSGVWTALAGFPLAVWVFAALKDLAADQVKGFVAKKV